MVCNLRSAGQTAAKAVISLDQSSPTVRVGIIKCRSHRHKRRDCSRELLKVRNQLCSSAGSERHLAQLRKRESPGLDNLSSQGGPLELRVHKFGTRV